jgi:2-oxoisovalerate dehydrogenase E1 component alpha subunit
MAVPRVAERAAAYGLHGDTVDGNDALAIYDVMRAAVERAYRGDGPSLIEARCYRVTPHSSDDDDRTYRPRAEVEEAKRNDPVSRFAATLTERGILTDDVRADYEARARQMIDAAQREAEALPYPPPSTLYEDVYAPADAG